MMDVGALARLFDPRAVALVGLPGDPARPGARPLHFLRRHGYRGRIFPVNPRHREIGGLPAYPALSALPERPDVAWIGVPADQAPAAVRECGRAGIPFAVVLGAGFAESGPGGVAGQSSLLQAAREAGVRLVGPNTVGFVNAWDRVALTFSTVGELDALRPGPVALLSQSGGVGGCLVDRAAGRARGVGLFVSTGNEADLQMADYLEWLVEDGRARAVACLVEQVRSPERFRAALARARERGVPVVALKLGTSGTGARAARSHTASLAGGAATWRAWARAAGLLAVESLDHLVETAAHLAAAPELGDGRAAMVTSSGGIAVLLADALDPRGFSFPPLGPATAGRVAALLPGYAAVSNPVDVTAGLPDDTFREVLRAVLDDPGVDVTVVPLTMATADGGQARARAIVEGARGAATPLAVCWPGGSLTREGRALLEREGIACFSTVGACAAALGASLAWRRLRRCPPCPPAFSEMPLAVEGTGALPWAAVCALLRGAGLPLVPETLLDSVETARRRAPALAYPVVVKVIGPLHRTEIGGVRVGLDGPAAVVEAVRELLPRGEACIAQPLVRGVEVLVGAVHDPGLGAFVLLAPGGVQAELYGERALAPAPVDPAGAEALVDACPALARLLAGHRGASPGDRAALVDVVVRVSRLAAALGPRLGSLDLNPVIVRAAGAGAAVVDARVVLDGAAR